MTTTEKIIQDFTGKDDTEIHQFIYDIAKDNFTLKTKNDVWFSKSQVEESQLNFRNILKQILETITEENANLINWKSVIKSDIQRIARENGVDVK